MVEAGARRGARAQGGCRQCARTGGGARIALFVPVFSENGIIRRGYWRGRSLTSAWSKDGVAVVVAEMIPEPVAEFLNCECNMTVLL